jgi:hypothetical protein
MTRAPLRAVAVAALGALQCAATRTATAQGTAQVRTGWQGDASALAPVAELERGPAQAPPFSLLLVAPFTRAGLYWTLGNPGALPFELQDTYTAFRARYTDESGAYRRPLDAATITAFTASGSGWKPVGNAGALSGGVVVKCASLGQMASGVAEPYSMSPHFFADTSGTTLGETAARLDGAGGWRVGGWGLGLALGFDTWTALTGVSMVPRFQRGVLPAATAGITRKLGDHLVLGAHARRRAERQTASLSARGTTNRVYRIEGFTEPVPIELGPSQGFYRRIERDAAAAGLGAAMVTGGTRWVAHGELTQLHERQSTTQSNDPPLDKWDATGHVLGFAAETQFANQKGRLLAGARWTHVTGEATRAALVDEGILFHATDDAVDVGLDLRLRLGSGWETGARLGVNHDYDARDDILARVGSALRTWTPSFSLETACDLSDRLAVSLGAGVGWRTPIGSIPDPGATKAGYQGWLAPELSYYATPTLTDALRFAARWRAGGQEIAVQAQYGHTTARGAAYQLPFAPAGSRETWDVAISIAH